MQIQAIRNHILFQFLDHVNSKGEFEEATSAGGIHILSHHSTSANSARWAKVLSAGPECSEILKQPNCEILIEPLKWTKGVEHGDEKYWRTDEEWVMCYRFPE